MLVECDAELTETLRHYLWKPAVYAYFTYIAFVRAYFFFFFSSRRRHTRSDRDWSSDVCSSDLPGRRTPRRTAAPRCRSRCTGRSEERRVGKSVDLGGRRIIKKKKKKK